MLMAGQDRRFGNSAGSQGPSSGRRCRPRPKRVVHSTTSPVIEGTTLPIIDTHVHLLSFPSLQDLGDKIRNSEDVIQFRTRYPELYYAARSEEALDNSDHLVAAMDRNGVGQALVSPTSGNTTNEQVAAAIKTRPGRLFGLFRIGHREEALGFPDDPKPLRERTPDEIQYCLEE